MKKSTKKEKIDEIRDINISMVNYLINDIVIIGYSIVNHISLLNHFLK